jgi:hypothetical protein
VVKDQGLQEVPKWAGGGGATESDWDIGEGDQVPKRLKIQEVSLVRSAHGHGAANRGKSKTFGKEAEQARPGVSAGAQDTTRRRLRALAVKACLPRPY